MYDLEVYCGGISTPLTQYNEGDYVQIRECCSYEQVVVVQEFLIYFPSYKKDAGIYSRVSASTYIARYIYNS
jgi:hypothetical protein